jgi:hypothetical protein
VVATAEGSTIWYLKMKTLEGIVDELMELGEYEEGLKMLEGVDERTLPEKVRSSSSSLTST